MGRIPIFLTVISALPILAGLFVFLAPFVYEPSGSLRVVREFYFPSADTAQWVHVPAARIAVSHERPEPCAARCLVGTETCQIDCGDYKGYEVECKDAQTCKVRLFHDMSQFATLIIIWFACAPVVLLKVFCVLIAIFLFCRRWMDFNELDALFEAINQGKHASAMVSDGILQNVHLKFAEVDEQNLFMIHRGQFGILSAKIKVTESIPAIDPVEGCYWISDLLAFQQCMKRRLGQFRCSRFGPRLSFAFLRAERTDGLIGYLKYRNYCYTLYKPDVKKPKETCFD